MKHFMTLQNSLANYSFLSLLGSMIFYWIGASFRDKTDTASLSPSSSPAFFALPFFALPEGQRRATQRGVTQRNKPGFFSSLAQYGILISNILLGLLLLLRWKESGHFPLSNLYESLMFLSWCFTVIHLFIENYTLFYPPERTATNISIADINDSSFCTRSFPSERWRVDPCAGKEKSGMVLYFGRASNTLHLPASLTASLPLPKQSPPKAAGYKGGTLRAGLHASKAGMLTEGGVRKQVKKQNFSQNFVGAITTPSALLTNAFATFTLPKEMQESSPLVPALQSNWLMMHVTVMILSYAALIIGSLLSIAFLIVSSQGQVNLPYEQPQIDGNCKPQIEGNCKPQTEGELSSEKTPGLHASKAGMLTQGLGLASTGFASTELPFSEGHEKGQPGLTPLAVMLDNLSYRILGIGFPLLTIGILSGAVWANEAWGSYWSWDPKETWALATWLIFAIYLHTRLSKGWEGKKPAIIASFGFIIVWVCYLGVNLIGEGLHSYGWLSTP
uniref:Cytochrome c biogenesis protein CcsA n=1 Tax=Chlorogonium capillatum TaxID=71743 RepID=A0A0S2ICD1_9CHLO|nr:heme attachment to plastid cytochrome c [Chlorogonium capillatum]